MSNDELFVKLDERIDAILNKLKRPARQYNQTINELTKYDIFAKETYRSNFGSYYGLRFCSSEWKDHYFKLLEEHKHNLTVEYSLILDEMIQRTGRIEGSFSSKLVATINPQMPVLDSVVIGVLGYEPIKHSDSNRQKKWNDLYLIVNERLNELINDERFMSLKQRFVSIYSDYKFTDIKILDLLLWQLRDPKPLKTKKKRTVFNT